MSADGTGESQADTWTEAQDKKPRPIGGPRGLPPAIPLTRQVSAPAGSGEWTPRERSFEPRRPRVSFMSNDVASSFPLPPSPDDTPTHLLYVQQHEVDCNKMEARREGFTFGKNGHKAQERRRTSDHAQAQAQAQAQTQTAQAQAAHAQAQTQAQLRMAQLRSAHDQARGSIAPGSPTRGGLPPGSPDYPRLPQGAASPRPLASSSLGLQPPPSPSAAARSRLGQQHATVGWGGAAAGPAPQPNAATATTAATAATAPATAFAASVATAPAAPAAAAAPAAPAAPEDAATVAARRLRERSAALLWRPPGGAVQAPLFIVGMGNP